MWTQRRRTSADESPTQGGCVDEGGTPGAACSDAQYCSLVANASSGPEYDGCIATIPKQTAAQVLAVQAAAKAAVTKAAAVAKAAAQAAAAKAAAAAQKAAAAAYKSGAAAADTAITNWGVPSTDSCADLETYDTGQCTSAQFCALVVSASSGPKYNGCMVETAAGEAAAAQAATIANTVTYVVTGSYASVTYGPAGRQHDRQRPDACECSAGQPGLLRSERTVAGRRHSDR